MRPALRPRRVALLHELALFHVFVSCVKRNTCVFPGRGRCGFDFVFHDFDSASSLLTTRKDSAPKRCRAPLAPAVQKLAPTPAGYEFAERLGLRPCSGAFAGTREERCHGQPPCVSRDRISPGSHSAAISKGRQQISQSVVKRWEGMLVSMTSSKDWPQ